MTLTGLMRVGLMFAGVALGQSFSVATVSVLAAENDSNSPDAAVGIDHIAEVEDLPPSRVRDEVAALDPAAQKRALESFQAHAFPVADLDHLHFCSQGTPLYVCGPGCRHAHDEGEIEMGDEAGLVLEMEEAIATFDSAVPVSPFPASLKFHSNPGSENVIFLNFSGDSIAGTRWNEHESWAPGPDVSIEVRPYDIDGDYSTFNTTEQQRIFRIWLRVAEDYAPFDVNVTTERPSQAMFDTNKVVHVVFSEQFDENGYQVPYWDLGVGVAAIGAFGLSNFNTRHNPAWVMTVGQKFDNRLADVASHEVGHVFGLLHHGLLPNEEYYEGHVALGEPLSWKPIMGQAARARQFTRWSNGEYFNANRTDQDDMAIIASKIGFRPNDHGNTNETATPLIIGAGGVITATTVETDPENNFPQNRGMIGSRNDVDVFSFLTDAGDVNLEVAPLRISTGPNIPNVRGATLDVSIELYDSDGTLLESDDPDGSDPASITYTAEPGVYFLHVTGSGAGDPFASDPTGYTDYGSLGNYSVTGSIVPPASIYHGWAIANGLSGDDAEPDVILQPDGLTNLLKFAFGLDPNSGSFGPVEFIQDGELTKPGVPTLQIAASPDDIIAVYIRRKDYEAAVLTYTVQFSADLKQWTPSNTSPTVLTDANSTSDHEVVGIPFPNSVPVAGGGEPLAARFMRLVVTLE